MLKRVGSAALLLFSVIVLAAGVASGIEVSDSAFYYEQGKITGVKGKTVYVAINTAKLKTLPKKHLQVELIDDTGNVRGIIGQIVMDEGALSGTMFLKSGATVSEGMHVRAKIPGFSPTTTSSSASSNDTCSTMPDGQAECTTKTGAQYNGKLKNGKPHGKGVLIIKNGRRYEGEFVDGFMEGDGKYILNDEGYYEGEFKKNKFAGSGELVFSSGARYKGEFKDDRMHGSGKYTFKDGGYYEGAFVDGKRTGQGVLKMANGNEYEGEFKDGKFHGMGKLTFKAGGYWEGTFVDGKLNGKGLKVYADGGRYEGDFVGGKPNGKGLKVYKDGGRYEGDWVDGKRTGWGVLKMPNGYEYEGQFKDDKSHGKGISKRANGDRYEGDFVDGKLVNDTSILFGAIYYDAKTGSIGTANNYKQREDADKSGKAACQKSENSQNCKKVVTFSGAKCGALAVTDGDGWGGAGGSTKSQAETAALEACKKYNPNESCRIAKSVCTTQAEKQMAQAAAEAQKKREHDQYVLASKASSASELREFVDKYANNDPDNLVPTARERLKSAVLQEYRNSYTNARTAADFEKFISDYQANDPDRLIPGAKKKLAEAKKREAAEAKAKVLQQYRESFKNARSSDDFDTFIKTYTGKDPDKLIPKAKQMKAAAEKRERQERAEAERREQHRREHACDHLYAGKPVTVHYTHNGFFGSSNNYAKAVIVGISNAQGIASAKIIGGDAYEMYGYGIGTIIERSCSSF